jgi:PD-(D/E)XK endonuclease
VLTSDQKGALAEAAIIHAALEQGVPVSRPLVELRYDLIFDLRPTLLRVQCKWGRRVGEVINVQCYRNRRNADGLLRQFYSRDEVDAFAVYSPDQPACYLIPFDHVPACANIQLRLGPTKNNQARRIRWAKDYEFAATLSRFGAVAQLGERQSGTLEAAGSSPAGSTPKAASPEAALF